MLPSFRSKIQSKGSYTQKRNFYFIFKSNFPSAFINKGFPYILSSLFLIFFFNNLKLILFFKAFKFIMFNSMKFSHFSSHIYCLPLWTTDLPIQRLWLPKKTATHQRLPCYYLAFTISKYLCPVCKKTYIVNLESEPKILKKQNRNDKKYKNTKNNI